MPAISRYYSIPTEVPCFGRETNLKNWEIVTKDELMKFVKSYPCKLDGDYYMDTYTWNDFRDGRVFPESMVAMIDVRDEECRICKDYI